MQQQRDKDAPEVCKSEEDDDADEVESKIQRGVPLLLKLTKYEEQLAETRSKLAPLLADWSKLTLENVPGKFRTSFRSLNLHSHDRQIGGYAETKIGGHVLDHKRPFYSNWQQQLLGPIKTAICGAIDNLGESLIQSSAARSAPLSKARTSLAFSAPRPEVLVYSTVKIGGHPLDHVPFLHRGLPSRPLLGFVPESDRQVSILLSETTAYEIAPNVTILCDCSHCFRLQQWPRVQLCCGHCVCANCLSLYSFKEGQYDRTCFLKCPRCKDEVAVEALVFSNYMLRLESFSAPPHEIQEKQTSEATSSVTGVWKQGGVLAALSFIAGRCVPFRPSLSTFRRNEQLLSVPDEEDEVAAFSKGSAKVEILIAKGPERWAKRVQGLQPPSKLLKFSFVRTLGVGNFAEVMLMANRKGKLTVLKESDKLTEAANEINLLSRVQSPYVVQIQQHFIEEIGHRPFVYIEMEYCDGGDLRQMLERKGRLKGDDFDAIFRQLCLGLKEIHRHGIVHRDLKPGNVLLTSDGTAKLADFGVSTYLESDVLTHHAAGTLAFMAPEVRRYFLGETIGYDFKADIWSLGVLAVAMLTGNPEPQVATRPVEEVVQELKDELIDEKYTQLVKGMLAVHPADRTSLEDLLEVFVPMTSRL